ncbi:MAG: hypothetical protein IT376_12425 [Polyangiaceae bacterium]|nr:hypothetical protein [Polyangiaceae bacterium]
MNTTAKLSLLVLSIPMLACGLLGTVLSFNPTTTPSTNGNYDGLQAAAKQKGWRVHRGNASEYNLSVYPAEGETINFTENLNSHNIDYNCTGGRFEDDSDRCAAEVRALCVAAFGESCEDFD